MSVSIFSQLICFSCKLTPPQWHSFLPLGVGDRETGLGSCTTEIFFLQFTHTCTPEKGKQRTKKKNTTVRTVSPTFGIYNKFSFSRSKFGFSIKSDFFPTNNQPNESEHRTKKNVKTCWFGEGGKLRKWYVEKISSFVRSFRQKQKEKTTQQFSFFQSSFFSFSLSLSFWVP